MKIVDTVNIVLNTGDIATIEISDVLLERIQWAFNLQKDEKPTATQVKHYLTESIKNALGE